jgi:hypothetical protein
VNFAVPIGCSREHAQAFLEHMVRCGWTPKADGPFISFQDKVGQTTPDYEIMMNGEEETSYIRIRPKSPA